MDRKLYSYLWYALMFGYGYMAMFGKLEPTARNQAMLKFLLCLIIALLYEVLARLEDITKE